MANRYAVATGNWSATGTWDGGTLPGVADIVRPNGFTVTIDQDINVAELRGDASAPAVANGGFVLPSGRTVNAKITSGTSGNFFTFSGTGSSRFVIGDIVVGGGANAFYIASSQDMLYHTGNVSFVVGATGRCFYAYDRSTLNLTGNCIAGTTGTSRIVEDQTSAGYTSITVTGNLSSNGAEAVNIFASLGTPAFVCNGTITASSAMCGVVLNAANLATVCDLVAGANGHVAIRGPAKILMGGAVQHAHTYRINTSGNPGTARTLYTGGTNLGQPSTANVRSGTTFGASSEYTGTLAVPSPTLVAIGVATDNTVGSYTASGGLDAAGVRNAIGLASANLDTQLASKASAASIASLNNLSAAQVTAAVPTTVAIANEVQTRTIARVTLVDTCTVNTDMRGTDNAMLAASYTAPDNASVTSIKSKTDNLPSDPADQSLVEAAITAAQVAIIAQVDANETKIDSIQSNTNDIQTRIPAALESGRIAAALSTARGTQIDNIENAAGYTLAVLSGACADPQTASETYAITVFGSTFTVDMAGQTSTGTRTAPTLTKT